MINISTIRAAIFIFLFLFVGQIKAQDKIQYELGMNINTLINGDFPEILVKKRAKRYDQYWRYKLNEFKLDEIQTDYNFGYAHVIPSAVNYSQIPQEVDARFAHTVSKIVFSSSIGFEQRQLIRGKFLWYRGIDIGVHFSSEDHRYTTGNTWYYFQEDYGIAKIESRDIEINQFSIRPEIFVGLDYTINEHFKFFVETGVGFDINYYEYDREITHYSWRNTEFTTGLHTNESGSEWSKAINLLPRASVNFAYTFIHKKK